MNKKLEIEILDIELWAKRARAMAHEDPQPLPGMRLSGTYNPVLKIEKRLSIFESSNPKKRKENPRSTGLY